MDPENQYWQWYGITTTLLTGLLWVYFGYTYPPLGIFFGWLPALPIAMIAALLWPLLWFAVLALIVFAVFTFAR